MYENANKCKAPIAWYATLMQVRCACDHIFGAQMVEKKQTFAHEEESLNTQEKVATDAINQADELLNDATQKLHVAINEPSMNQQSVKVAATMLDVAKTKRVEAMQRLQKINEKRKVLGSKKMKLLEKAIPSKHKQRLASQSGVPRKKTKK